MKSLMKFEHINAASLNDAISILRQYGDKAWVLAGGTDLVGTMRFEVLRDYPEVLVNLKTIPGLDFIKEENGNLKIGALTRLEDIATNPVVRTRYTALSEAARRTASPHVRAMGTIGGNLCQLIRCWYFRKEENRFDCIRKGGSMCHAVIGDNRYHSIFGAARVAPPPCSSNCPAGNDIPSYLSSIRDNNIAEAAQILLSSNPMPAITGRICPHACEQHCNRGDLDEALSIRSIERFVGDYILDHAARLYPPPRKESKKRVAVIGSGPAGLSAAYFLRKFGYRVTVLEAREKAGGVLTYGIPPYRLAKDVVNRQIQAIEHTGVQFRFGVNVGKDLTLDDLQKRYSAVFCATGAWKSSVLGLPNEGLLNPGLDFLEKINSGLRTMSAKKILVIGGGSVAMDVATSALRAGAQEVIVACVESRDEMPALPGEVEQAVKEGIKLMPSWGPSRILKTKGTLSGLELVRCTSVYDSEHRFAPTYDRATRNTVEADQVILAAGQRPDLSYAKSSLDMDRGLIVIDPDTQVTSVDKVFAGGDATISGPLSVVAALASGRRAAEAIHHFLGGSDDLEIEKKVEHLTRCDGECLEKSSRVKAPEQSPSNYCLDKEDVPGLDSQAIEAEAKRCFNCGCDGVNPSDIAPALIALNATIVTTKRKVKADKFWVADKGLRPTLLENDEIIIEIQIPRPAVNVKSSFIKFAMRKSIDFPIVNCAAVIESRDGVVKSARICLNAVYSNPYRATKAEEAIEGKFIDEANAEDAGAAAVSNAISLPYNKFKIQIAKTLVKRAILACGNGQGSTE
jgi:NADPH-dependent glutamate synthase beta subunit-like oxidoreductase/CO/xanthine dehydrogenase FAD-binding subunit